MPNMQPKPIALCSLSREIQVEVLFQLPPRHVYKLMQTNKQWYFLCRDDKYWERVAVHYFWKNHAFAGGGVNRDLVLLQGTYRSAVDTFIDALRNEIRAFDPPYNADADAPLSHLASVSPEDDNLRAYPGETMRALIKRHVEDAENVPAAIQKSTNDVDRPIPQGFITGERRRARTEARFLHALDDDPCDLDTKRRLRGYVATLLRDITDRRGKCVVKPNGAFYFELHEADIEAAFIYID
jgi:F-box domain